MNGNMAIEDVLKEINKWIGRFCGHNSRFVQQLKNVGRNDIEKDKEKHRMSNKGHYGNNQFRKTKMNVRIKGILTINF